MRIAPEARAALREAMEARRLELGLRWQDVATNGGLSLKTLHSARAGNAGIAPLTRAAIEKGLRWEQGTVARILTRDTAAAADDIAVLRYDPPGATLPPLPDLTPEQAAALQPFLAGVYRDLYRAAGIDYGPHQEVPELPAQLLRVLEMVPGARIFADEHERATWDTAMLDTPRKLRFIADVRRAVAGSRQQGRNTG